MFKGHPINYMFAVFEAFNV